VIVGQRVECVKRESWLKSEGSIEAKRRGQSGRLLRLATRLMLDSCSPKWTEPIVLLGRAAIVFASRIDALRALLAEDS
jgi:hypothetical protein